MTRILRIIFPVLSVGLLAAVYYFGGLVWPALGLLVLGVIWIVGLGFRWEWVSPLGLFAAFGTSALGLSLGLSTMSLISSAIFALLAWDLADFFIRLEKRSPEDDTSAMEKLHLFKVALLAMTCGVLTVVALTLRIKSSFEWMVVLMFFAVWGIGRLVNRLLKIN